MIQSDDHNSNPVGNRLNSLGVSSYSHDVSNHLSSTSSLAFTYDANGNTLVKSDTSQQPASATGYTWDAENRLTSVALPGSGGTVTFKYDPFGRRIEKSGPSGVTIYAYDGANIVAEYVASGALAAKYTQGPGIDEPTGVDRTKTALSGPPATGPAAEDGARYLLKCQSLTISTR